MEGLAVPNFVLLERKCHATFSLMFPFPTLINFKTLHFDLQFLRLNLKFCFFIFPRLKGNRNINKNQDEDKNLILFFKDHTDDTLTNLTLNPPTKKPKGLLENKNNIPAVERSN